MILRFGLLALGVFLIGCYPNSSDKNTSENNSSTTQDSPTTRTNTNTNTTNTNSNTTGTEDEPPIEECSKGLKMLLADFLPEIETLEVAAKTLKSDKDNHSLRELKNFVNDRPIGRAFAHCAATDELMKSPHDLCSIDKKTIDLKKAKNQCTLMGKINTIYRKFSSESDSAILGRKPSALSGQLKTDVEEFVDEIIKGFAQ